MPKRQELNEVSEKKEQIDAAFKEMELKHKKAVSEYKKVHIFHFLRY